MVSRILLVGATGLVGQGVLKVLLQAPSVSQVTVLVRRPLSIVYPRVRVVHIPEFSSQFLEQLTLTGIDACLYCAGPLPSLLDEAAYRAATVGVLGRVAAAYANANPGGYLAYVSGMGADANSRWMPLRVKGLAEAVPRSLGLASTCLRPGIIRPTQGERSPHAFRRAAYALGAPVLALAEKLLPGTMTTTDAIGRCMLHLAQLRSPRPVSIENWQINEFSAH